MKTNALGRGLATLLKEEVAPVVGEGDISTLPLHQIEAGPYQPRKRFDEEKIRELADSIVSNGLIQPIVVNQTDDNCYKIIAGERRFRACALAGLAEVPVIIKNIPAREVLEIALIENIQREELTAIEEAEGYQRLIDEFKYTQAELANTVGKSRSHVGNILRLNSLPDNVKELISNGELSMGHARCLIGNDDAYNIAKKVIENGLNVRQTEQLTRAKQAKKKAAFSTEYEPTENKSEDDFILLGHSLSEKFGVKVVVENSWNGGKISFHYDNLEELDRILSRFN